MDSYESVMRIPLSSLRERMQGLYIIFIKILFGKWLIACTCMLLDNINYEFTSDTGIAH